MKRSIAVLLAFSCLAPAAASSQSVGFLGMELSDSTFSVLARTNANRAGIAVPITSSSNRATPDRTRADRVTDRIVHTLIGGFLGTVGGGGIGAAVGAYIDRRHQGGDGMIPGAIVLGVLGAIAGLATGLIVGVLWPVR